MHLQFERYFFTNVMIHIYAECMGHMYVESSLSRTNERAKKTHYINFNKTLQDQACSSIFH